MPRHNLLPQQRSGKCRQVSMDKRLPEADHLRLIHEKGVEGVAKLIGYQRITSISELRSGLSFPSPHRFRDGIASASTSFSQAQLSQSFGPIQNLSISKTSSKRKRPIDERGSKKRSRSNSQKSQPAARSNASVGRASRQLMSPTTVATVTAYLDVWRLHQQAEC